MKKDRLKASSNDCLPNSRNIDLAIKKIYSKQFIEKLKKTKNPYGAGGAVNKTFSIIKKRKLRYSIKKTFYDN